MSVVLQPGSWQGRRWRSPVASLWPVALPYSRSHHAPSGRCITIQGSVPASPETPMTQGRILSPSGHPSPIPLRPTLCSLDTHQGSLPRPLWNPSTKGQIRCPYGTDDRLFRHGFGPKFDLGNLAYCETALASSRTA